MKKIAGKVLVGIMVSVIFSSYGQAEEKNSDVETMKLIKTAMSSRVMIQKVAKAYLYAGNDVATTKAENIFPARELYLKMDLNYIPKIKILYRTIIKDLDKYKVFGIEQILELNKIKYSIIKTTNNLQLFINFDKKSQAIKVQQMFEDYNFDVKLKEVKIVEKIKG